MYRKWLLKIAVLSLAALTLSVNGFAAAPQFGLGISITEDGEVIHCPIKLNPNLRLEGSFGLLHYNRENSSAGDIDSLVLKFGAYIVQNVYEKTDIYYGGKMIYVENDFGGSNRTGIGLGPAFGFEYYLTNHISVGGEAELVFHAARPKRRRCQEYGTDSRVILRYYF